MKVHRFYVGGLHDKRGQLELTKKLWVHDQQLLNQWLKVLKLRIGEQVILFDDLRNERLYKINVIENTSVGLELVTELKPKLPNRHSYLLWALLKSDKNDLVLQKCTEIGISNFVPIISARTEKTGFDEQRAQRIVIEAAEQCGRSDIPQIREPLSLADALGEYQDKIDLYICQSGGEGIVLKNEDKPVGVLVGPEGGWDESELDFFRERGLTIINIANFILRAETACIQAAGLINF